jgi:hypothetical protein
LSGPSCFDPKMARASNVRPPLSDDPRDTLSAALNWHYAKLKGATYDRAPMSFDACREWHDKLTPDQRETCLTLADVIASAHKGRGREHRCAAVSAVMPPTT